MSLQGQSFLSTDDISASGVDSLFSLTTKYKEAFAENGRVDSMIDAEAARYKLMSIAFFEPSTRTRMSFQTAAFRLGMRVANLDSVAASSMKKGETQEDTLRNIAAMQPDIIITRYGSSRSVEDVLSSFSCPVINAGGGTTEHPTQALLDAFTIQENRGKIKGEKILIVGDVLHSRVANSNIKLLTRLGAEVGICAPEKLGPKEDQAKHVKVFKDLNEAVEWCDVLMGLRIQSERHDGTDLGLQVAQYREKYRIGTDHLNKLSSDAIILHPGPVITGVEFSNHVLEDSRSRILDQVKNGVFIRTALLTQILGLEV